MKRYHTLFLLLAALLMSGCQQKKTEQSLTKSLATPTNTDSLTLDLLRLQTEGKLKNTVVVTVISDPVYHTTKQFNAISLNELLVAHTSVKNLDAPQFQIVFECEDGYKPVMPLKQLLSAKAFIALSDVQAPKGKAWAPIIKNGHEMKAAPFYLIYQGISAKNPDYKWPYNLIKIHLIPNKADQTAALVPKNNTKAEAGFELFNKNCLVCHAINKIGGSMGPELNYPKSVTEYWDKDQLKAFIKNPASFRNGVKMPTIKTLTPQEINAIVYYLEYMAAHK